MGECEYKVTCYMYLFVAGVSGICATFDGTTFDDLVLTGTLLEEPVGGDHWRDKPDARKPDVLEQFQQRFLNFLVSCPMPSF